MGGGSYPVGGIRAFQSICAVAFDRVEGEAVARGQAIAFYGDASVLSIDEEGEILEAHLSTIRRSVIAPPHTPG